MKRNRMSYRVGFGDCDPARIIYYPKYFELFDRAAELLFDSVGLPWHELYGKDGVNGLPLLDASANFRMAVKFGDTLEIESWIEEWRRKTFLIRHDVFKDGALAVEGRELRAWAVDDPERPNGIRADVVPVSVKALFED